MAAERATALVVRGTDWSETSRILTLFTREFGKVRALAKGGRRLKSNFEVSFDLLSVCKIMFLRKAHAGLDLLTEARMDERFPHLRTDLRLSYGGYYVAELLADGTQDYDPHPQLFDTALDTLRYLPQSPIERLSAFELVWLDELGYSPQLDVCAVCMREMSVVWPTAVRVGFSPEAGGVICPDCFPTVSDRRPLSAEAWTALRALSEPIVGAANVPALPPQVCREVRAILGHTVSSILGRRPRMLDYLDGLS